METIGVVGATGLVGQWVLKELIQLPECHSKNILLFASEKTAGNTLYLDNTSFRVELLTDFWIPKIDFWFFATPKTISAYWIPRVLQNKHARCIDGSQAFRLHANIPLVIPEINGHTIQKAQQLIASPNCTTTIVLMALWPLHQKFHLKRFWVHSYQSAAGMGNEGILELEGQLKAWLQGTQPLPARNFHKPLAFNAIPQIGSFNEEGYAEEELKLILESKKILEDNRLKIFANCVRIPVMYCHSVQVNADFFEKVDLATAQSALKTAKGLRWFNDDYPTPLDCVHQTDCGIGRLRYDKALDNGLALWAVGDSLLKGAAFNMVQIFHHWNFR